MVAILNGDATERIGRFDMRIRCGEKKSDKSEARWRDRSEALAAWLLEQWNCQQRETAERN